MGQEFRCSLSGSSASRTLTRLKLKCQPGLWPDQGRICFQAHLVAVIRIQCLTGYWTEGLSSFLIVGWRLPSVSFCVGPSNVAAYFIKISKRESPVRRKSQSFVASWKWHPITFAIFYSLEASPRLGLPSKGRNFTRAWVPGGRGHWDHLWNLPATAISYSSGPQTFWYQRPVLWKTIFPWTGG